MSQEPFFVPVVKIPSVCCKSYVVAIFDYRVADADRAARGEKIVNRMCLKCYRHWHGELDKVREYTRVEWDALMNSPEEGLP